jgi:hypothetical protein
MLLNAQNMQECKVEYPPQIDSKDTLRMLLNNPQVFNILHGS